MEEFEKRTCLVKLVALSFLWFYFVDVRVVWVRGAKSVVVHPGIIYARDVVSQSHRM